MSADSCELTVRFAPMPRARRAAYRNAMDILAEYLLKLEAEEAAEQDLAVALPVLGDVALQSVYQQPAQAG